MIMIVTGMMVILYMFTSYDNTVYSMLFLLCVSTLQPPRSLKCPYLLCVNLLSLALDPVYSHGFRQQGTGQTETNEKVTVGKKKRKEKWSKGDSRIRQR